MKSTDVIISGGGIPGFTLGILLARAGFEVVLCDPAPLKDPAGFPPSGRTTALMESSLDILGSAGLLEKIEDISQDLKILSIVDPKYHADFKCGEIGLTRFGQNVQNNILQAYAGAEFAKLANARLIQGTLVSFETTPSGASVEFSNGETIRCKLLVGADGRNSAVRKGANIEVWEHDYDQIALTGIIKHTKPHNNASTEFHFSGGPFTIVPMQDNKCSFVWMEKTVDAKRYTSCTKQEIESVFNNRTNGFVGEITLESPLESYPIKIQKSKKLVAERVALIAEAAHVLSPIGAQGMNLSLRDVASLANVITNAARLGLDFGSSTILKKYEDERFLDISMRVMGTDALNRSVATENSFLSGLRRLGFKAATNLPPLRALLVREGLSPRVSLAQDIVSGLETRATVRTSTREAPAA